MACLPFEEHDSYLSFVYTKSGDYGLAFLGDRESVNFPVFATLNKLFHQVFGLPVSFGRIFGWPERAVCCRSMVAIGNNTLVTVGKLEAVLVSSARVLEFMELSILMSNRKHWTLLGPDAIIANMSKTRMVILGTTGYRNVSILFFTGVQESFWSRDQWLSTAQYNHPLPSTVETIS